MDKSEEQGYRILFVMDSLFTGGAEYSTLRLAGWLKKSGWTVRIVCLKTMNPSYDLSEFELKGESLTLSGSTFLARLRELDGIVRDLNPDIVHSVLLSANFLCRSLRLIWHHSIFVESLVNRTYDKSRFTDPNVNRFALKVYKVLDRVTQKWGVDSFHAVTQDIAQHYHQETGTRLRDISVIFRGRDANPLAGDREVRTTVRSQLQVDASSLVFLTVGRHEFQKAQLPLLAAFSKFKENYGANCYLLIAGREGMETPRLKSFVHEHGLERNVLLLGHRGDVYRLMIAADIFVLPSLFEGIGGVLIEAAAAGLPVIASDLEGLKEVLRPLANAMMVMPGDAATILTAMHRLADDPVAARDMGKNGLVNFNQRFEISVSHTKMKAYYESLLTHRKK